MKIRKLESHETGHIDWKNLNQTCCQSVPTAAGARPGFSLEARPKGRSPAAGVGFLGKGKQPPSHQLRGLGNRCDLPSRIQGGAPTA